MTFKPTDRSRRRAGTAVVRRGVDQSFQHLGQTGSRFDWAGWVYAVDADSGQWRWRAKTNYPVQSGMTPTAGGVVFFGDMGGNFYALDADDGR